MAWFSDFFFHPFWYIYFMCYIFLDFCFSCFHLIFAYFRMQWIGVNVLKDFFDMLAQVWTHYKIGKLNMWTLFCNVCIDFLNSQIWKEIMLELNAKPFEWFFLSKPGFLEFIWIFSHGNHFKISIPHILNPNLTK